MGRVNPQLRESLENKLNLSRRQIDRLIADKAGELFLPRAQAALVLAAENKIGILRYASPEDLLAIRQAKGAPIQPVSDVVVPPPTTGRKLSRRGVRTSVTPTRRRGKSVFVVHGRNESLRRSLFQFLRSVGLNPIEWRRAIELTGKPSPYVAEILDAAFREAVAIVVLFSPDDEAKLMSKFVRPSDQDYEKMLKGQPRPNVLFEAGMAFGRNPESTVLVQVGDIRPFSDVAGRHIVHLKNSADSRHELVTKLANAGCNVQTSGSDWLSEGNFEL